MRWNKYTINTRTDAEELVCAMLSELGITSVGDRQPYPGSGCGQTGRCI